MIKEKTKALIQLLERTPSNEIKWKELIKYLKELEKSQQYVSPTLLEPQDNNKGRIMNIDTSRMTPLQVKMHHDRIRLQEKAISKQEFEQSLRESTQRTTNSGSALFGANKNMFQSQLAKDTQKMIDLNRRKTIQKQRMIEMIDELNEQEFKRFESTMIEFYLTK